MYSLGSTNQVTASAQPAEPITVRYSARGESGGGGVAKRMSKCNSMTPQEFAGMMSVYGFKRKSKRCISVIKSRRA